MKTKDTLKRIWEGLGLGRIFYFFDPQFGQSLYAKRTLKNKEKAINVVNADSDNMLKHKSLWLKKGGGRRWLNFYYTIGDKEKAYLYCPDNWFYTKFDKKLNDWRKAPALDDKNLYQLFLGEIRQPKVIVRKIGGVFLDGDYNLIDEQTAFDLCRNAAKVIVKRPTGSSGGKGIAFWEQEDEKDVANVLADFHDFIVQEIVEQHPELEKLHPDSLNTIRIMTMTSDNEVMVLSTVVRMGVGGVKVDNASSGGIFCGVNSDGRLKTIAFDANGRKFDIHPQGARFEDTIIPFYKELLELTKKTAPRFAGFSKLISWDFAVGKDGQPTLIEVNLTGGQVDLHQIANGPIFGDEETTKKMIAEYF